MTLSGVATWSDQSLWGTALSENFPDIMLPLIHEDLNHMYDSGTIPFLHPMFKPETTENRQIVQDIRNTHYDDAIDAWLQDLKRYTDTGRKCVVVPYPEMNGIWVNYGPDRNNFNPSASVDIYRHFVRRGRQLGLTSDKVLWCWAPNDVGWGPLAPYWPGDSYVDIVGGSAYNWGGIHAGEPWETPAQVIGPYVSDIRELTNKPIIITQTGSGEGDSRTPGWLDQLVEYVKRNDVEGFIWFSISEFTYAPGAADFKSRVSSLVSDRPVEWFGRQPTAEDTEEFPMPELSLYAGYRSKGRYGERFAVSALQILLARHGFADARSLDGTCAADGYFGRGTEAALKAFQRSVGLVADGVCGLREWSLLVSV